MKTSDQRMKDILKRADERSAERTVANRKRIKIISITAVFLVFVLAINLILFIPYNKSLPDISRFADSQYYPLMQQLNALTYSPSKYENNFDAWFGDFFDGSTGVSPEGPAAGDASPSPGGDSGYVEVTDNQVEGVVEADLFKRTQRHIFYLRNDGLTSYTIAGRDSAVCGELKITAEPNTTLYMSDAEMYLSSDGGEITIFTSVWSYEYSRRYTVAIFIDVSDPVNMEETGRVYISGEYVSSRMVGDDFLLVSNFTVRNNPDFSDEGQFLPQYGSLDDLTSLTMDEIFLPENANAARYTIICRIGEGQSLEGHIAFLSFSDEVYVSQDNIFVTRNYMSDQTIDGESVSLNRTQISCVSYSDGGLTLAGQADVNGVVLNQYSMDEKDGTLRVVTTTDKLLNYESGSQLVNSAALYVIDLSDFSEIASLENFAPDDEEVTSVRFDGDLAWVCTARIIEITDPVFCIDLSDLSDITCTDTGTIEGYSTSLVNFTDGTLLGIGYSDMLGLKVEVYEQDGDSVVPVTAFERDALFSEEYKSYYIDRENGYVGMHIFDYEDGGYEKYILLHFDGYEIRLMMAVELDRSSYSSYSYTRATIIDGWLYVLTSEDFKVVALPGIA